MVVLLTDFGPGEYAGVMKGVIYHVDSEAKIVDLCHDISPQSKPQRRQCKRAAEAEDGPAD